MGDVVNGIMSNINWIWFGFAVVAAFAVGAIWYSLLFFKTWSKVFKVDMPDRMNPWLWIRSFVLQLVTLIALGLTFFILAHISFWFSQFALLAYCGWQVCNLTFKYANGKRFLQASFIEAGNTYVVAMIFIAFAYF